MSSRAAVVRGCSVFVLLNEKRPHGLGMRLQRLREPGISSRGRVLHRPEVQAPGKRLTSGHMTQAQTRREARQRQADMQEIAFRRKGHFPPQTHRPTHTHTRTHAHTRTHTPPPIERERARNSQRLRDRERIENGTGTNTYTHRDSYSSGTETNTRWQRLRLLPWTLDPTLGGEISPRVCRPSHPRDHGGARLLGRLTRTATGRA